MAAPLVRRLEDPEVTFGVEVINEPEALSPSCVRPREDGVPWEVLSRSIRRIGDSIHEARPGTVVTAGTLHTYLPDLYRQATRASTPSTCTPTTSTGGSHRART